MMEHDLLGGSGANALLPVRYGHMLVNRHDTIVGRSLEYYGEYFEQEVHLFRQVVRAGDVVVDAGANIGAHTVPLARMVGGAGRVLAYEPIRLTHQLLCANAAINGLGCIDCVHAALGSSDGTLMLRDLTMDAEDNYGAVSLAEVAGDVPTPVRRLDSDFHRDRLRFIKIDVEGMEAGVLDGARATIARFHPALYVENDRRDSSPALIRLLWELGYACFWFLPSFHNPHNFRGRAEPLYQTGFFDDGTRVCGGGLGINLFCVPKEVAGGIGGMRRVDDAEEHPLDRAYTSLFAP